MSDAPGKKFFGKYRGTVAANVDPEFKGRISAIVPDVLGIVPTTWALPCVPMTGTPQAGVFVLPPIGANVWMEFEHGDPDFPIWTGCFWGTPADVPLLAKTGTPVAPHIILQTVSQNTLMISGDPVMGIMLSCGPPTPVPSAPLVPPVTPSISISQAGVVIGDGKGGVISIAGGQVTINKGALVITQP